MLEDGTFIKKDEYNTRKSSLEHFLEDIICIINSYQEFDDISGVAISMPGFVDISTGYTDAAGAISILNGKNLKVLLEEQVPFTVEIENDGNCVALAEKFNGNAINCRDFICITLGTGVGGGIFLNNEIYHGHKFRAGEIGYMLTPAFKAGSETWSDNGSTSNLVKSYKKYKDLAEKGPIEGHMIFEKVKYDKEIYSLVEKWAERISFGIFNLSAILNPEKILLGGGVSAREELVQMIVSHLNQLEWWKFTNVPIETCKHKNDAGMLGALVHYLSKREVKKE